MNGHRNAVMCSQILPVNDALARGQGAQPDEQTPPENRDLKSLAQVTRGLAPALNDLLTVITGRASLLLDATEAYAPARESLSEIYTAGEKAVSLIRQLLLFSGQHKLHPQILDLNRLAEDVDGVLRRMMGTAVAVEFRLAPGLPPVPADAGMMEQIFLGLALNAHAAMPRGGRLTLSTSAVTITDADAANFPAGRPGSFVVLSVADTGCGIAPEIRPRIFEPFFTTKAAGRSMGLGLAVIFGIVQQHQGWVTVESQVGAGAEFKVFLPAAPAGAPAETAVLAGAWNRGGRETILLVEDDVQVREITVAVLQSYGYRVLQAESAAAALEAWKWHGARIELLLTDMVLEGHISGLDLAQKLRAEKPGLRVICTSGHGREIMENSAVLPGGCHFLQKPCRPQVLACAVRASLDEKTA